MHVSVELRKRSSSQKNRFSVLRLYMTQYGQERSLFRRLIFRKPYPASTRNMQAVRTSGFWVRVSMNTLKKPLCESFAVIGRSTCCRKAFRQGICRSHSRGEGYCLLSGHQDPWKGLGIRNGCNGSP